VRVLVVEDEVPLAEAVARGLRREGMAVDVAHDGDAGLEKAMVTRYDVLVLDRDLPGRSGDDVCRRLAAEGSLTRVLMLTAAGGLVDRVEGLELGADDYLGKPFAFEELVARVRALGRRATPPAPPILFGAGDVSLDPARRTATRHGEPLELTRKEFDLLALLMGQAGTVVSRERLIDEVWDTNWFGSTKTLDVHVSGLRKKLGDDPSDPRYLHTVRGVGFRFAGAVEGDAT
jgi:DNA-binding response OmpR family regulator